ncbi:hypothetical protein JCM3774_001639 [Rhodotorula dairenensis]
MASPAPHSMPGIKPVKPPKLVLDKKTGPQPNPEAVFRSSNDFRKMYRAYQWLQGHDLRTAADTTTSITLVCATHPDCPFRVTAEYATLTDVNGNVVPCFRPKPTDFRPDHNHPPYYLPMDHAAENARRAKLQHDDPSLDAPPLVRAQMFAGSESDSDSASRVGPVGVAVGAGNPAYGFASADKSAVATAPGAQPTPYLNYPGVSPAPAPPAPAPAPAPAAAAAAAAANTLELSHHGMRPLATSASPVPPMARGPNPQQQQQQQRTPFQHFMLEIDPRFEDYFPYFRDIIPLDTDLAELLSLDSGGGNDGTSTAAVEDHTVFNMFRDVKELPLLLVAMAADGVRKAKVRFERDSASGGLGGVDSPRLNPKIAEGIEKARAERWVRERIKQGQLVLAVEGMQAPPPPQHMMGP